MQAEGKWNIINNDIQRTVIRGNTKISKIGVVNSCDWVEEYAEQVEVACRQSREVAECN